MKPIYKMTDRELEALIDSTDDDDVLDAACRELDARADWRAEQPDTDCIEWNGWDKPSEY